MGLIGILNGLKHCLFSAQTSDVDVIALYATSNGSFPYMTVLIRFVSIEAIVGKTLQTFHARYTRSQFAIAAPAGKGASERDS